ncbi:MAG TPA: Stp1/IreP family PP2C-type Ser/Thr phosphatase [Ktedonobacterales bacterium]|nr:Stp1/IreP family PP2C-type Ser/Thr phosphatase [Ktedonobacterales bacterium]
MVYLQAASQTDTGKVREHNEDYCYFQISSGTEARGIFIVADGMGGYQAGEVASKLAVDEIREVLNPLFAPSTNHETTALKPAASPDGGAKTKRLPESREVEKINERLKQAVTRANEVIVSYGKARKEARGLGSTVTVAVVLGTNAYIANVGDSRTYLLRQGELRPITKDHSLVARLVDAGHIKPEDVYDHPQRNLIYRSLGAGHNNVEVDVFYQSLEPGDMLLLCCDGLWEMVREAEVTRILSESASLETICQHLIDAANQGGGEDNITALVVRCSQ